MKFNPEVHASERGANKVCTSTKKSNFWYMVNSWIQNNFGYEIPRFKGKHGEPVYGSYRNHDFMYKDSTHDNILCVRSMGNYVRTTVRETVFGTRYVCYYNKWYTIENRGFEDVGKTRQRWWNLEIKEANEDQLKQWLPDIYNCEKTKDGSAEAWIE